MNRLWNATVVILILIVGSVSGKVFELMGRDVANAAMAPDLDTVLVQGANTLNARLPMMVDSVTRLDTTVPGPGKRFTYFYTLPAYSSTDLEPRSTMAVLTPNIKKNACGGTELKGFFDHGVSVIYVYRGNDAREIGRITVTPADCQQV